MSWLKKLLKKNKYKIIIWTIGGGIALFITNWNQPDFIEENDLVTWNALWVIGIVWVSNYVTRFFDGEIIELKEFHEETQQNIQKIEVNLQKIEHELNNRIINLEKSYLTIEKDVSDLKIRLRLLDQNILEHSSDCIEKYECQGCGFITNEVSFIEDDYAICDECHEMHFFEPVKQSFHFSKK